MTDELARVQSKQIGNNVHVNLSFFSEDPKLLDRVDAFLGAMLELYKARQMLPNERIDELIKANSELVTNGRVDKATVEHFNNEIDNLSINFVKVFLGIEGLPKEIEDLKDFLRAFMAKAIVLAKKQYDVKGN